MQKIQSLEEEQKLISQGNTNDLTKQIEVLTQQNSQMMKELNELLGMFEDTPHLLNFKHKLTRSKRKNKWRKKKREKELKKYHFEKNVQATLNKIVDEWQQQKQLKHQRRKILLEKREELMRREMEKERKHKRKKELAMLVTKLEQLRRLRVKQMLGQGKTVEDNKYFENLSVNTNIPEQKEVGVVDMETEAIDEDEELDSDEESDIAVETTTIVDPQTFYSQAYQSIDNLVNIREAWDFYLAPSGAGSRIPSHWIEPPKPSSNEWAKYLVSRDTQNTKQTNKT